jgi:hypothetical protein
MNLSKPQKAAFVSSPESGASPEMFTLHILNALSGREVADGLVSIFKI